MNIADPQAETAVAHAIADVDGRLLSADPPLDALNLRAGGGIGAPIAVPQLATIARLARRLGIIVSRRVIVADDDVDVELWVRAQPEGNRIRIAASGWREQATWRPASDARRDLSRADADWRWETDAALRLTFVSIDAGPRFGFDALALLGRPLTALFAFDADGEGGLPILGALARRRPLDGQAARLVGSGRRAILSATIREDVGGVFAGFVGAVRMVEDELPAADAPPVEGRRAAGFTAGLDKALRTPLARIVANADSINAQADGPVRSDYADYAADIASAGRHLLGLVDDLVDLQAIERPDFALRSEPIDLADVARRAAGLLAVRADAAGVAIVRPAPDATMPAQGDFGRAMQIVINLVGNAVRYSPPGSAVEVRVARDGDHASVTVVDQGKGIAAEDQARIFEKFERVDTSEVGGNGLGLYIARRLARAMGGDLNVKSVPREGARFVLDLPAR